MKPSWVSAKFPLLSSRARSGILFRGILSTWANSLGSISYYEPTKKILIPGDLVFRAELLYNIGSFGRYDFPGGSLDTLKKSIEHITELDVLTLLPGHMGIVEENANLHIALSYKTIQTLRY